MGEVVLCADEIIEKEILSFYKINRKRTRDKSGLD